MAVISAAVVISAIFKWLLKKLARIFLMKTYCNTHEEKEQAFSFLMKEK